MGLKLFDDGADFDNDEVSKIEINKEYARRYEHNKKREDLQRLEEMKKKGLIDESSSSNSDGSASEDDDLLMNSSKEDLEFFDALIKIKKQDPILKEKDSKLFDDASTENEEEEEEENQSEDTQKKGKEKREKAMYLKDVVAKQLVEEGPEFEEEAEGDIGVKSYGEEQEEIRKAFLDAAEKAMDGELLKEKVKENGDDGDDEDGEVHKKLDEYFGEDGKLDTDAMFLKDYFLKKMWVDKEKGKKAVDEEFDEFEEDEEEIEKQEDYEREYNFRFEENAGDRVLGHARFVEGSVRKRTNARKVQRKSKEERMAIAELERKEELKHLKNLKKKEYMEMLNKVREVAGIGESEVCPFDEDDLEKDFDADEYDRKMKQVFDENYYGAEDADPEFCSDMDEDGDLERPDFDKEDELLELPKGWDVCRSGEGFVAARGRYLKGKVDIEGDHDLGEEEIEPEDPEEGKRKRKRKLSLQEKLVSDNDLGEHYKKELEEELYKLDYEDTIGDLKTRFKYQKVGPKRFGLSTEEILMMDDKELNQYVSLKKLAPYREKDWKVPSIKRYEQKMRNKSLLQGEKLDVRKTGKKKSSKNDGRRSTSVMGTSEGGKEQLVESNGDMGSTSRGSRRRRRQAELKLSHSRLVAYGKVLPKPKSKAKH